MVRERGTGEGQRGGRTGRREEDEERQGWTRKGEEVRGAPNLGLILQIRLVGSALGGLNVPTGKQAAKFFSVLHPALGAG